MNNQFQSARASKAGILAGALALALLGTAPVLAQETSAETAQRAVFDAEICKVDGLDARQCQCVWDYLQDKLKPADFRLGLLLIASNSDDSATVKKADEQLDKSNASDKRRDEISSEMSALIIDAEDACP
ncbi:MAG: hypothetical protein KJ049_00055 [Gammaproteobacteria bacterium]|jgi:hypothetical protein|nr:hypothetical protein [Gammaproteobacteria bacterium]